MASKTVADVMKMVKDNEIKFVDFRFTDTRGKEQHVTVPVSHFDEDKFSGGHAFDGSSIAGWKGIEASDMLLMPDPNTANIDPFFEEPTLLLTCDVLEPGDGKPYERDPRSLARRAEAYLKSSGIGDAAFFGPEPEFFVFDSVRWSVDMSGSFSKIESEEAAWNSGKDYEHGNSGMRPGIKGGYFPVPPVDSFQDMRSEMCLLLEQLGIPVEVHHHEVATAGQMELGTKFSTLVQRADWLQLQKYVVLNVAHAYGKTATFMPKPIVGDNGSGMHVHQSVWKDGKNLFAGDGYAGLSDFALYYIGGIIKHARALNAITNPGTNSYKRLVPGFEAPVKLAYSSRNRSASIRIPYVPNPKGRRIEARFPDPLMNPYLGFSALLMAGLDGVENKIHPGEAATKDLYHLPPEEDAKIPTVCHSLDQALDYLDKDRAFLTKGGGLHRRLPRRLHRAEDAGSDAFPDDDAPARIRHVLRGLTGPSVSTQEGGASRPFFLCIPPWATMRWMVMKSTAIESWLGALLACACSAVFAEATVYRCPGPPVLYTDQITPAQAKERGCRTIEGAPITVVSTPKPRPLAGTPPPAGASRASDAKVEAGEQRARDSDARKILDAELKREEAQLAELQKEFNNGEPERQGGERNFQKYQDRVEEMKAAIARKQSDVAALKRELAKLPATKE